jgi:hypothetical protein
MFSRTDDVDTCGNDSENNPMKNGILATSHLKKVSMCKPRVIIQLHSPVRMSARSGALLSRD